MYGGGKRSSLAPSILLGRLFGPVDGRLHDLRFLVEYVKNNVVHARVAVRNRAWCVCPRSEVCMCKPLGEPGADEVYDAVRYAISRLVTICQNYGGGGVESYVARLCMVAFLPLTRMYDTTPAESLCGMVDDIAQPMTGVARCAALVDIDNVLCFDTMPSLCSLVWAGDYWYEGRQFREGSIESAYHHVFGKTYPLRCHFRNMQKICVEYGVQHGEFADFMYAVVRCSLMGLCQTATSSCGFEAIRRVDTLFSPAEGLDSGERCAFVCRFGYVMFHAVKEYLCHIIRNVAGLSDVLDLTYRWWMFERRVADTTCAIRLRMSDEFASVEAGAPVLEPIVAEPVAVFEIGRSALPFADAVRGTGTGTAIGASDEEVLLSGYVGGAYADRRQMKWSRTTKSITVSTGGGQLLTQGATTLTTPGARPGSFEAAMGPVEDAAYRLNNDQEKNMFHIRRDPLPTVIRMCLGRNLRPAEGVLARTPRYEPLFLDTAEDRLQTIYHIPAAVAATVTRGLYVYNATGYVTEELLLVLEDPSMPESVADAMSRYCEDTDISSMFHFVALPEALRVAQLQALQRKFAIMPGDTDDTELRNLSEVYFCLTCMSFKAFVVESATAGIVACGSVGVPNVVYDYADSTLQCRQCVQQTRMFRFCMAGMIVRVGRHNHILCTVCGSITILDPLAYRGDAYACATCVHAQLFKEQRDVFQLELCALPECSKKLPRDNAGHYMVVCDDTADGATRIVAFCRAHRNMADQVRKNTDVLTEINTAIVELIKENLAPRHGSHDRRDITRFANAARRYKPYSLIGGRR
jgi:hypothetical protein